ncbi:MAG: hypothetical protein DHS20C17_35790 [Cyclobacteriaceae bacterium]|nr:MAG: hypothetical protein DHS20C17_35790 [Cyclobacteriaceae bacterium]
MHVIANPIRTSSFVDPLPKVVGLETPPLELLRVQYGINCREIVGWTHKQGLGTNSHI